MGPSLLLLRALPPPPPRGARRAGAPRRRPGSSCWVLDKRAKRRSPDVWVFWGGSSEKSVWGASIKMRNAGVGFECMRGRPSEVPGLMGDRSTQRMNKGLALLGLKKTTGKGGVLSCIPHGQPLGRRRRRRRRAKGAYGRLQFQLNQQRAWTLRNINKWVPWNRSNQRIGEAPIAMSVGKGESKTRFGPSSGPKSPRAKAGGAAPRRRFAVVCERWVRRENAERRMGVRLGF